MRKISVEKLSSLVTLKRNEFSLTKEELGNLTGINRQIIGRIESGKYVPSLKQLEVLLDKLEIDFSDIMEELTDKSAFLAMRDEAKSAEEKEGLEKMISMMLCLRKHKNLRRALK